MPSLKNLSSNISVVKALVPQSVTGTANGDTVDRAGYAGVTFSIELGAISAADASNKLTVTMEHGDLSDMTDAVAVTSTDLIGTLPVINNTNQANLDFQVDYIGNKRYVRLVVTEAGTFSALMAAQAILSVPRHV